MNCKELQEWLSNRDLFEDDVSDMIETHLETCAVCKKLYAVDSILEAKIRDGLKKEDVPERLLSRIEMNMTSVEMEGIFTRFLQSVFKKITNVPWVKIVPPFALAVLLLLFVNPFGPGFSSMDEIGTYAATDHMGNLSMAFAAENTNDVSGWFENEMGFKIAVPDI